MPLSESYKILSRYREDQPTYSNPSRDVVMLPQISVSDGELSKLYSAFQGGDTKPVFPEWFHDVDSYCVRNLSLDEYQYYWMQYFTFFTPGLDYSSYQSSEFVKPAVESSEIRRIMLVLASSTPYINLDCFNNNDLLLQQMVSSLNVFSMTENLESQVRSSFLFFPQRISSSIGLVVIFPAFSLPPPCTVFLFFHPVMKATYAIRFRSSSSSSPPSCNIPSLTSSLTIRFLRPSSAVASPYSFPVAAMLKSSVVWFFISILLSFPPRSSKRSLSCF